MPVSSSSSWCSLLLAAATLGGYRVGWLYRGTGVQVLLFLVEIKHTGHELACKGDLSFRLTHSNTFLESKECYVFSAHNKIFILHSEKGWLWEAGIERGLVKMFPTIEDVVERERVQLDHIQMIVIAQLKGFDEEFGEYFGQETLAYQWVRNPFSFPVTPCN